MQDIPLQDIAHRNQLPNLYLCQLSSLGILIFAGCLFQFISVILAIYGYYLKHIFDIIHFMPSSLLKASIVALHVSACRIIYHHEVFMDLVENCGMVLATVLL